MNRVSRKECLRTGLAAGLGLWARLSTDGIPSAGAAASTPARSAATVGSVPTIPQTWNNCGPASVAEVLAYWGIYRTQNQVQAVLRVDGVGHGMGPYGVPSYARGLGMDALVGVAGSVTLLKALISNGFPVIVTQWVSMTDHTSHYRPITAYDDRQGIFLSSDPLLGPNHMIGYADFAEMWGEDDNRFMVLYPQSRQAAFSAALTRARWTRTAAYRHDLAWVQDRLTGSGQTVASWVLPVAVPGARFLRLAWDQAQLGQATAARDAVRQATAQGAAPLSVGWVSKTPGE